jgi:hypothetical protein
VRPEERPQHPTGKALLVLAGVLVVVFLLALVSTLMA